MKSKCFDGVDPPCLPLPMSLASPHLKATPNYLHSLSPHQPLFFFLKGYLFEVSLRHHLFGEAFPECFPSPYLCQSSPLFIPTPVNCNHPSCPPQCALVCDFAVAGSTARGLCTAAQIRCEAALSESVGRTDEGMTSYLQPAPLQEPPQTDSVNPKARIKRIAADACYAGSQVVTVNDAAIAQAYSQEVVAVQPWNEKMHGACSQGGVPGV